MRREDHGQCRFYEVVLSRKLVEHLFVGEVLKYLWLRGVHDVEVLTPAVAHAGYDLVLECKALIRHIELKASLLRGKRRHVGINLGLRETPSGCVIWIDVDPADLRLGPFWWFGGAPGQPLPDLSLFPAGQHTRGKRTERANIKKIPKTAFEKHVRLDSLIERLFGQVGCAQT